MGDTHDERKKHSLQTGKLTMMTSKFFEYLDFSGLFFEQKLNVLSVNTQCGKVIKTTLKTFVIVVLIYFLEFPFTSTLCVVITGEW